MNIRKAIAALGLTVVAFSTFAALPASAQYYHHHFYHHPVQRRHAARLDRQAAHATYNGHYRRAVRLRTRAARLRHAANHGY